MKATSILALASTASAANVAIRAKRHFETESASEVGLIAKFPLDIAALEQGAILAAEPREFVDAFLKEASKKNLAALANIVSIADAVALPIGGAVYFPSATKATLDALEASTVVEYIDLNAADFTIPEVLKGSVAQEEDAAKNEWGVEAIGAPEIWKYSTGKGAVVGSIDSGALHTHEAIKHNWRSELGWFDPYERSALPRDTSGHGSHTIGTMVGANGIGVAPGAQWIACIGLNGSSGTSAKLLECAQFMLCPTKPDGTGADCKKGPHVVNNSWGSASYTPWFEDAVAAWKAAGIVPIFANGNSGTLCATVGSPGGYKTVIGVGAIGSFTNEKDKLAYFSSKGPQTKNGAEYFKPDVSAPGFFTRSVGIANNTAYAQYAGTSMAAPHVAGVVAIIKSVDPTVSYDAVYKYLTATTDQKELNTTEPETWYLSNNRTLPGAPNCGGLKDSEWPNNRFGHGRVNIGTILRDGKLNDNRRPTC
ncbi:hypothetical protein DYB37_009214 [Aphanomyces astaci]|uniref:subtilisin n=1 Tax=Aphanomyces astaci TaxID=112090 RepID=A0A3R6XWW0_APHAT|nr:hypothetical protein DYB35_011762 [Aphanomyces astaci]RHZ14511.1 hypothetical protein DYB37_009214 [Aphanomyces astaci]